MNHDLWERVCDLPHSELFMLLGEGTFDQVHGGIATNSPVPRWPEFAAEYEQIRGRRYQRRHVPATYVGELRPSMHPPLGITDRR